MIKKDTIVSTTDGRLTLLQWLKKVEKALKDSTVTGFTATPTENGQVVFAMTFTDGSTIAADPIAVPAVLDKYIKLNADGNLLDFGLSGAFEGGELYLDGRLVRLRSYKEGVWDNIDVEIQNTAGRYITVIRIRKNDIDGKQVRVMPGGSMDVDDELTANTIYIGGRKARLRSYKNGIWDTVGLEIKNSSGRYIPALAVNREDTSGVEAHVMGDVLYIGGNSAVRLTGSRNGSIASFDVGMYGADGTAGYKSVFHISCTDGGAPRLEAAGELLATEAYVQAGLQNAFTIVDSNYSKARYQHTVTIKFDNKNTAVLAFTAMSSDDTAVNTLLALSRVFGGRRLACSGGDTAGFRYVYLDTHPASTNDYVVGYMDATGFHTDETIGTLKGTGFAIEDDVTPN